MSHPVLRRSRWPAFTRTVLVIAALQAWARAQPQVLPERASPAHTLTPPRAQGEQPAPPTRSLRVLSYNIHHGEGLDGRVDLERIASIIRRAAPDIVALQEVDRVTSRTQQVDQIAELAQQTAMEYRFGGNLKLGGGEYGNAVLSRLPIIASRNLLLPSLDQGEQRGVLLVDVQLQPSADTIRILATHFDHRPADEERRMSAVKIAELLSEFPERPHVLIGDLNARRDSRVLAILQERWTVAGTQEQPTIPADSPNAQIDFVLYHPAARWRVVETTVLDEPTASDHRPLLAVLELIEPLQLDGGGSSAAE